MLVRYANSASNIKLAKRIVEVYAVVLIPIVTFGLLLILALIAWIQIKIIGLERAISPISPYDHPVVWIIICFFFSAYFINKSISQKNN
jgi:hypothetical protein